MELIFILKPVNLDRSIHNKRKTQNKKLISIITRKLRGISLVVYSI